MRGKREKKREREKEEKVIEPHRARIVDPFTLGVVALVEQKRKKRKKEKRRNERTRRPL